MTVNGEKLSFLASQTKQQEEYENRILPSHGKPGLLEEYEEYMSYDTAKLKALTGEQCSMICIRLIQYSLYVQRCFNRDKSKVHAIKSEITRCIANKAHLFPGQWELQREQATADNNYTKELREDLIVLEQRVERFAGIAATLKTLAEQFKGLQFSKARERD